MGRNLEFLNIGMKYSKDDLEIYIHWDDSFGKPHEYVIVAKNKANDKPLGAVAIIKPYHDDDVYVKDIQVQEYARRRGVATHLYDWVKEHFNVTEIKTQGTVRTSDGAAFRFSYDSRK